MRTEYLLNREVEYVLAALTPVNRLVLRVCLHTGLRVGDVLSIKTSQLAPRLWLTEAKTGKRKQIGFPADLLRDLRAQAGEVWVFESRCNPQQHRSRQAVWADVKRAAKAFRLPQNVAPHSFRKVYAAQLLDKYGDIEKVRRALNHGSQATTLIYALADKQLEAKYRKRRSRA
jgi:integrase